MCLWIVTSAIDQTYDIMKRPSLQKTIMIPLWLNINIQSQAFSDFGIAKLIYSGLKLSIHHAPISRSIHKEAWDAEVWSAESPPYY